MASNLGWAEVVGVNPDQLEKLIGQGAMVIDIRTPTEWQSTGTIRSSQRLTFFDTEGTYDGKTFLAQLNTLKSSADQAVVLVCLAGGRSSKVGVFLDEKVGMKNVYHLENGIKSWIKEGKQIEPCPDC